MKGEAGEIKIILILCLSLGLAPYFPEPHIIGKIRWVFGGGKGMGLMDWMDFVLHGFPWAILAMWLGIFIKKQTKKHENII